ncbi:MAG: wax ester/triacylglycerol synthase domain-containing protein [Tetrasphaera sp.]
MNEGHTWGGGAALSPWDTVMWRLEEDPHTRSTSVIVEVLDRVPDWDRLVQAHIRGSFQVPRMRERVVEPPLPLVTPAWSADPNFDVDHHLYRIGLPEPGTFEQLGEVVADVLQRPLDRTRPPWEAVLVTGLEGGKAAYLFKSHHSFADGMALMQMLELLHSRTSAPGTRQVPPAPKRPKVNGYTLLAGRLVGRAMGTPGALLRSAPKLPGKVFVNPFTTTSQIVGYARSLGRQVAPTVERSPLLKGKGGLGIRVLLFEVSLDDLRSAGRAAGGSINDAYLAAVVGGLRRYHEHRGHVVPQIPISIPVSTRRPGDPLGGNQFTGVRLVAPLGETDPEQRIILLREQVRAARSEAALDWLAVASRVLDKLPVAALAEIAFAGTSTADAQLSNFPGVGWEAYVAGAKVLGIYPVGPRPGVAMMAALASYEGKACLGFNVDPDVFPDIDLLHRCLLEGFDEVFTLTSSATDTSEKAP